MNRFRKARYWLTLALFCGLFAGLFGSQLASAAEPDDGTDAPPPVSQEEPTATETLEVYSRFPVLQNSFGSSFEYEITLYYEGTDARTFDLDMELPEGWVGIFVGGYPETEISAFTVEPGKDREAISLIIVPTSEELVGPDSYTFIVNAASGNLEASVELEGIVVPEPPLYQLYLSTATLAREFTIKPKQENHISLQISNSQTGAVDDISFSADAPEGWEVNFTPAVINMLQSGVTQEVDMVIVSPADEDAGDYPLIVNVDGVQAQTERELRITVATSETWGVAGVIAVVAAVVVLAIWFRKSGTR